MNINDWLELHAIKKSSEIMGDDDAIWVTKGRGDYITRLGMEEKVKFLADYNLVSVRSTWEAGKPINIGFSPTSQKWYGWSHRAIYGFGIGSTVSKGDCAYIGATPEDMIESRVEFYRDSGAEKMALVRSECQILPDMSGICILHAPLVIPVVSSINEALEPDCQPTATIDLYKDAVSIIKCGRGEWTAKTLEDAKQMAMDFAEGVA